MKLAHHLQQIVPKQDIKVMTHSWQIELRGDRVDDVKDWLTAKGF